MTPQNLPVSVTPEAQVKTLTDYIASNDKLLTALGVFTALTIFFSNLEVNTLFKGLLSASSLFATVLIWFELWEKFPAHKSSIKLMWFENVLSIMSIALFIYWVYEMQNLIPGVLVFILAFLIMWPITALIKKYGIFNKLFNSEPNKKKGWRYAIGLTILLVIFVFSIFISSVLSPNVKKLINQIELKNPEVTPSTNYKLLN